MPINLLFDQPIVFALWVGATVFAITIHEFSHALAGKLQGDPTAELEGRLTLNPLAHIDWLGFFLLVIAGFGWAKPTPFNPYNLKFKKFGPALVAMAGPIANLLAVAIIGTALAVIARTTTLPQTNLMVMFFDFLVLVNLLLAIFNFIPIPPLDGSKVLYTLIADKYPQVVITLERYGTWFLLLLVIFGGGILGRVFNFFYDLTLNLIY